MLVQEETIITSIRNNNNTRQEWSVPASQFSKLTRNLIRDIVENLQIEPNPEKPMIALSLGDPTVFGNLLPDKTIIDAVENSIKTLKYNGYAPSTGYPDARQAVANYTNQLNDLNVNKDDVILCSGCSGAIEICVHVLGDRGKNILVPRPGFSLYTTLAEGTGIESRYYNLIPEKNWEVDLNDLEKKIDDNTAAIVIINPSNPCGSVYTEEHLLKILDVAARNFVPIIADEIYEHIVFPNRKFTSLAQLTDTVPILKCSGLAKRFLVPGWRLGWIIIHDRNDILKQQVRKYLLTLTQRLNGPNTLIQGALNDILTKTPSDFYDGLVTTLYDHSKTAYELLKQAPGLKPIMPDGAMYMMVGVEMDSFANFNNGLHFVEQLVVEQSVFCLPGEAFCFPGYMRLVMTVPKTMLIEACERIIEFCNKYYNKHTQHFIFKDHNDTPQLLPAKCLQSQ